MGRFAFWLSLAGSVVGAVFGAIDLDLLGGVVGAVVGGLAGALVGQGMDLLAAPLFAAKEDRTVGKWFFHLIGLALLAVLCHELTWMVNFVSLAATHSIGTRIGHHVAKGDSPQVLQDTLKNKRWQVTVFVARPVSWGMLDDIKTINRTTQDLIEEVFAGRAPNAAVLAVRSRQIAQRSESLLDQSMRRTLLLRFVPRDFLIPKE